LGIFILFHSGLAAAKLLGEIDARLGIDGGSGVDEPEERDDIERTSQSLSPEPK